MAEHNLLVGKSGVMNRYPGFDTSNDELLEMKDMASRLRQALLRRLGSNSQQASS